MKETILENDAGVRVHLCDYGARIHRICVPDREGRLDDVVLGFDRPEDYLQDNPCYGAVCGRVANRIAGGRFQLDGREYQLARNHGKHHLHGGEVGWDRRSWGTQKITPVLGPAVCYYLESPAGEEGYPGAVRCSVYYSLGGSGTLRIEYRATADAATPINLTNHAYFHLGGPNGSGDVRDHELTIAARRFTPMDADGIPTGEFADVAHTALDFRAGRAVGEALEHPMLADRGGYDHNFVLDAAAEHGAPAHFREPPFAARLRDPASGRVLEVYTTEPGLQLYTGNYLSGPGKDGREYGAYAGLCLEAQHFPDAVNQKEFPSVILRPGEEYHQISEYRFATD